MSSSERPERVLRGRRGVLTLAVGIAVLLASWVITPRLANLDDGYIALSSAEGVLAGHDLHYGGSALVGVTAPPYVLLLAGLLKAGLPALTAARAASALGLMAFVGSLVLLARIVGLRWWSCALFVLTLLTAGPVLQQATNWLETGWAMAVAIALVAAVVARRPVMAGFLAGLLPWLRPDLAPMSVALIVAVLWQQPNDIRLRSVAAAGVAFLPWTLWVHGQTGAWIPQTMAAKAAFFAEGCQAFGLKAFAAAGGALHWSVVFLPLSAVALFWIFNSPIGRLGSLVVSATVAAYTVILPGALWHNDHRYLYPIAVPWLAFGLARCMLKPGARRLLLVSSVLAINLFLLPSRRLEDQSMERVAAADWIRTHVDPRATLMVHDAGVFAVFTPNPLVDLVGLKTPSSIAAHKRWTLPSCGTDRAVAIGAIDAAVRGDYLVVTPLWDSLYAFTTAFRERGLTLDEVRASTVPYGYNVYRVVR